MASCSIPRAVGFLTLAFLCSLVPLSAPAFAQTKPRWPVVLIRGEGDVTATALFGTASVSKHDQTIELAQQLLKRCPEVVFTVKDENPDYALFLNRADVGFFSDGTSQIMLLRGSDHTVLFATKKGSVSGAAKQGCKAILADWQAGRAQAAAGGAR